MLEMNPYASLAAAALAGLVPAFFAGAMFANRSADPMPSALVRQADATEETFDWGTFYTYYEGESYGTKDGLTGVAIIKPGWQIHPPHQHAEEEYLMVTEGRGTWHLNGEAIEAEPGDILYAAPWDVHGIKNTGSEPLTFVVWKWNGKGIALPEPPADVD